LRFSASSRSAIRQHATIPFPFEAGIVPPASARPTCDSTNKIESSSYSTGTLIDE